MGWIGKLLGGILGFFVGGPIGAVVGFVLGHGLDWGARNLSGGNHLPFFHQSQLTFFVAAFSMISKLTDVDGSISPEEARAVDEFMRKDLDLDEETRETAVRIMMAARSGPQSFEDYALQFYSGFHTNPQLLRTLIDILIRVATADGPLTRAEENLIRSGASIFSISPDEVDAMIGTGAVDNARFYAVLQSDPGDAPEEIKRKYRQLVNQYHPDKIASRGLPEEFAKYATDKFREIQEAYEKVRAERGF